MTPHEAGQLLAMMAAAYGLKDVSDDHSEVWYQSAFQRVDYQLGLDAMQRVIELDEYRPTPARFNAECRVIERARYLDERAAQPSLPAIPTAETERQQHITEMRAMLGPLSRDGSRGHDHRGPMPCPVCGGINPAVRAALDPAAQLRCDLETERIKTAQRERFGPRR